MAIVSGDNGAYLRVSESKKEGIVNPPDPNYWFTLKLVVERSAVKVYINNVR